MGIELNDIFQQLNDKRIVIYIDALEFIADCVPERCRVLQELYDVAKLYDNVNVITSCRSADRNAFLKLHTKYDIKIYEVNELSELELNDIITHYPVIGEFCRNKKYAELFKIPFYVNLAVSKGITSTTITNENNLREYIWDEIICLNKRAKHYGVSVGDVRDAINKIVFERAKKFLLGIHVDNIDPNVLEALRSEGMVSISGKTVRLKYDIFEDICFERYFDKVFFEGRGDAVSFYRTISDLKSCAFRRYQIWISNKLLAQHERDQFVTKLLFDYNINPKWKQQTKIGIVKSKHCGEFFEENLLELKEKNMITEFIQVINLYAFEARLTTMAEERRLELIPTGKSRENMIQLTYKEMLYDNENLTQAIIKMCHDYALSANDNPEVSNAACQIMEYYAQKEIGNRDEGWYHSSQVRLAPVLTVLYMLTSYAKEWLKDFFEHVKEMYLSESRMDCRWASEISIWTFENAYPILTKQMGVDLCELANCIFSEDIKKQKSYYVDLYEKDAAYGLSNNAYSLCHSNGIGTRVFLTNIFKMNLPIALNWAITFTNKAFDHLAKNSPDSIIKVTIFFPETKKTKQYWGNGDIWICASQEYHVPLLLSDIVYYAKNVIIEMLETYQGYEELCQHLLKQIKNEIYEKANNIGMLSIIEAIGLHFQDKYPGFALELASCFELLIWDIRRYYLHNPDATVEILKRNIFNTVGIPGINKRYSLDDKCNINLSQYVIKTQLISEKNIRDKAESIIDYLYSLIDSEEYDANYRLQAAKMDMRNPVFQKLDDTAYWVYPNLPKEEQRAVDEFEEEEKEIKKLIKAINQTIVDAAQGIDALRFDNIDELINECMLIRQNDEIAGTRLEDNFIMLIATAFCNKELSKDRRNELCDIWIKEVNKLFTYQTYAAEIKWIVILFKQLDYDLNYNTKVCIKRLLLNCIMNEQHNGLIDKMAEYAWGYLSTNYELAHCIFNTIIKLAEDEMNHQKYNAQFINAMNEDADFVPNRRPALKGVDYWINENSELTPYKDRQEDIIEEYLYKGTELNVCEFNFDGCDISKICHVANCGLNLTDEAFYTVIKWIFENIIAIFNTSEDFASHEIIEIVARFKIQNLMSREFLGKEECFEKMKTIMFDDADFTTFKKETSDFYMSVFDDVSINYIRIKNGEEIRETIENRLKKVEESICIIPDENTKNHLLKVTTLIQTNFYNGKNIYNSSYSARNIRFLNEQFTKYGYMYLDDFFCTLYVMQIAALIPDILTSVDCVLTKAYAEKPTRFKAILSNRIYIMEKLILDSFVSYSDVIKQNRELSDAFIHILELLIECNNEKAAVILDEFLIH